MKLIYMTEGNSLQSRELRSQLARIPEVLSEIKKVAWCNGQPLLAFLEADNNWAVWVRVVQRGLFQRLKKQGFKYSGLVRRENLMGDRLHAFLLPLLQSKREIEIVVIGPGYDDLHLHVKKIQDEFRLNCHVSFSDSIGIDRKLTWFWAEVRKSDSPKRQGLDDINASYH
ncbi:MAG: hypothetical protein ACK5V3_15805 [Bdellovibrionales bacterium]